MVRTCKWNGENIECEQARDYGENGGHNSPNVTCNWVLVSEARGTATVGLAWLSVYSWLNDNLEL